MQSSRALLAFSRTRPSTPFRAFQQQNKIVNPNVVQLNKATLVRSFASDSAALVKELRTRTQAGYMDCKKALVETNYDMTKAIEWLREKGALKAAAKADRVASEGLVGLSINNSRSMGVVVELNSETDFVSRGETFTELTKQVTATTIANAHPGNTPVTHLTLEQLKSLPVNDKKVSDIVSETAAKLGENVLLRRAAILTVAEGKGIVAGYVHSQQSEGDGVAMGRIGSLVSLECAGGASPQLLELGKKIATHVVGFSPDYVRIEDVPADVMEKHKKDFYQRLEEEKRVKDVKKEFNPKKVYEDIVLLEQDTIDGNKKVKQLVEETGKSLGQTITVKNFVKFVRGEGIQRQVVDIAKEVEQVLGKK